MSSAKFGYKIGFLVPTLCATLVAADQSKQNRFDQLALIDSDPFVKNLFSFLNSRAVEQLADEKKQQQQQQQPRPTDAKSTSFHVSVPNIADNAGKQPCPTDPSIPADANPCRVVLPIGVQPFEFVFTDSLSWPRDQAEHNAPHVVRLAELLGVPEPEPEPEPEKTRNWFEY